MADEAAIPNTPWRMSAQAKELDDDEDDRFGPKRGGELPEAVPGKLSSRNGRVRASVWSAGRGASATLVARSAVAVRTRPWPAPERGRHCRPLRPSRVRSQRQQGAWQRWRGRPRAEKRKLWPPGWLRTARVAVVVSRQSLPRVMSTGAMRGHSTNYAPAAHLSLRNCGTGRMTTRRYAPVQAVRRRTPTRRCVAPYSQSQPEGPPSCGRGRVGRFARSQKTDVGCVERPTQCCPEARTRHARLVKAERAMTLLSYPGLVGSFFAKPAKGQACRQNCWRSMTGANRSGLQWQGQPTSPATKLHQQIRPVCSKTRR